MLGKAGPLRAGSRVIRLLLDPMAVMLLIASVIYFLLGKRGRRVLALALIPVLGIDVVLEARSRTALD